MKIDNFRFWRKILVFVLIPSLFYGCVGDNKATERNENVDVVSILSTDLSIDRDPDDWFDLFLFLRLQLNPSGVILDHYASDDIENMTARFIAMINEKDITIKKGLQNQLLLSEGELVNGGDFQDGAEFILETMRNAKGKVRLIAVGTLRNEALAYMKDSSLFINKVEKLYFAAGNHENLDEVNINRDRLAADVILNAPIPKVWVPCTQDLKLLMSGELEEKLTAFEQPTLKFLNERMKAWRAYRPDDFLKRTGQYPLGKNLWSFPAFFHAAGLASGAMAFTKGRISMNLSEERIVFEPASGGMDLVLTNRDHDRLIDTFWRILTD